MLSNFSVELYPPKSRIGINKLKLTIKKLVKYKPMYFSVTFGACGASKYGTYNTVLNIFKNGYNVVPHLSCIGNSKSYLYSVIYQYKFLGIKKIIILRGDYKENYYKYNFCEFNNANELINFIRFKTGNWFDIKIAAYTEKHLESVSFKEEIKYFVEKVKLGVNSAITQYFYNSDAYFNFLEKIHKLGIYIPIIPGIMPITNYLQLIKFSKICGAQMPKWIHSKLFNYYNDSKSIKSFGIDIISEMCQKLLDNGVPSLHFYTLNDSYATINICKNLSII